MIVFQKQHYEIRMHGRNGCVVCNTRNGARYEYDGYRLSINLIPSTWIHGEAQAKRFVRRCEAHGVKAPAKVAAVAQGKHPCAGYLCGWL